MTATADLSVNLEYQSVASFSRKRPLMWGTLLCAFGIAWSIGGVIAWREDAIVGVILLGALGYLSLALGVSRLQIAFERGWYLCAGPSGLRFRVPAFGITTLLGGLNVQERHFSWNQVKDWRAERTQDSLQTWSDTVANAVAASIKIELIGGEILFISTAPFAESQYEIEENIKRIAGPASHLQTSNSKTQGAAKP